MRISKRITYSVLSKVIANGAAKHHRSITVFLILCRNPRALARGMLAQKGRSLASLRGGNALLGFPLTGILLRGGYARLRTLLRRKPRLIVRGASLLSIFYISYAFCAEHKYPFSESDRDPFSALVTKSGQILVQKNIGVQSFELKGIIYSKDGGIAMIGKDLYKKNDKIGDYVIVKIGTKKVILKKGEKLIILKLEE